MTSSRKPASPNAPAASQRAGAASLLDHIDTPADLRLLSPRQLPQVCAEVREYLLNSVSQSSGHLASGLGTVELTVALHYVYQTPYDQLVWDVGHQAYPHKILTGRKQQLPTIRQKTVCIPSRGVLKVNTTL